MSKIELITVYKFQVVNKFQDLIFIVINRSKKNSPEQSEYVFLRDSFLYGVVIWAISTDILQFDALLTCIGNYKA